MALTNTNEYYVTNRGYKTAKQICSNIQDTFTRKRAFAALVCMDALADYLYSQGYNIDISKNLYKIFPINVEFEFTDIHCNGHFIDVLPLIDEKYILIPKNHFENDILPDLYLAAHYSAKTKKVRFLGCIESKNIDKSKQDGKYYVVKTEELYHLGFLEELISEPKETKITDDNHDKFLADFINYIDGNINNLDKKKLIKHIIECKSCRDKFIDFFDYEMIAKNAKEYPDLLSDFTLGIVGAADVNKDKYKDFEEITLEIEKESDEYEDELSEDYEDDILKNKNIQSAIEDPLQILYGSKANEISIVEGKNMQDKQKTNNTDEEKVHVAAKEVIVKGTGNINPKYYAEDLSEGAIDKKSDNDSLLFTDKDSQIISEKDNILSESAVIRNSEKTYIDRSFDNKNEKNTEGSASSVVINNDEEVNNNTFKSDEEEQEINENELIHFDVEDIDLVEETDDIIEDLNEQEQVADNQESEENNVLSDEIQATSEDLVLIDNESDFENINLTNPEDNIEISLAEDTQENNEDLVLIEKDEVSGMEVIKPESVADIQEASVSDEEDEMLLLDDDTNLLEETDFVRPQSIADVSESPASDKEDDLILLDGTDAPINEADFISSQSDFDILSNEQNDKIEDFVLIDNVADSDNISFENSNNIELSLEFDENEKEDLVLINNTNSVEEIDFVRPQSITEVSEMSASDEEDDLILIDNISDVDNVDLTDSKDVFDNLEPTETKENNEIAFQNKDTDSIKDIDFLNMQDNVEESISADEDELILFENTDLTDETDFIRPQSIDIHEIPMSVEEDDTLLLDGYDSVNEVNFATSQGIKESTEIKNESANTLTEEENDELVLIDDKGDVIEHVSNGEQKINDSSVNIYNQSVDDNSEDNDELILIDDINSTDEIDFVRPQSISGLSEELQEVNMQKSESDLNFEEEQFNFDNVEGFETPVETALNQETENVFNEDDFSFDDVVLDYDKSSENLNDIEEIDFVRPQSVADIPELSVSDEDDEMLLLDDDTNSVEETDFVRPQSVADIPETPVSDEDDEMLLLDDDTNSIEETDFVRPQSVADIPETPVSDEDDDMLLLDDDTNSIEETDFVRPQSVADIPETPVSDEDDDMVLLDDDTNSVEETDFVRPQSVADIPETPVSDEDDEIDEINTISDSEESGDLSSFNIDETSEITDLEENEVDEITDNFDNQKEDQDNNIEDDNYTSEDEEDSTENIEDENSDDMTQQEEFEEYDLSENSDSEEYDENELEEDEYEAEEYYEEDINDEEKSFPLKKVLASVIVGIILFSGIGFAAKSLIFNKPNNSNAQNYENPENSSQQNWDNNQQENFNENMPQEENNFNQNENGLMPENGTVLSENYQENTPPENVSQEENNPPAEQMQQFAENQPANNQQPFVVPISVNRISWGVNSALAGDLNVKQYLQSTGKVIKNNLNRDLASNQLVRPNSPTKVTLILNETGNILSATIVISSGMVDVDNIVLQSVKQSMQSCPLPTLSQETLNANEQATGGKNIKISITVTY